MNSETLNYEKKFVEVGSYQLAYIEEGEGDPIVLLHGNPTSSFLWRNVIPHLTDSGRVIAPDLIGHGDSDKLPVEQGPGRYSFENTYELLSGLLETLGVNRNVLLVIHDWGSALGFHWAKNHPDAVRGIAYMEGIVQPVTWEQWPENARGIFQGFRSDKGEDLVLERNMFVDAVLPGSVLSGLTETEMATYRKAFSTPDDRQPTLNWPRQIPISGEPAHMVDLVQSYADFMAASSIPKLFVNADPGSILVGEPREFCRSWPNQQEVTVKGTHFIQEDSPNEIGQAVAEWAASL